MAPWPEWTNDKSIQRLAELQPESFEKFVEFEQSVYRPGKLSTKFKELMAVAVTHVTQCDLCIEYHTHKAKEAGATDEEIAEAVFVAVELRAGGRLAIFRLRRGQCSDTSIRGCLRSLNRESLRAQRSNLCPNTEIASSPAAPRNDSSPTFQTPFSERTRFL